MSLGDLRIDIHSLILRRTTSYAPVACVALFFYDYLLTIIDESNLVWAAPWSFGKIVFFLTRYPAFVDISLMLYYDVGNGSKDTCHLLFKITDWMILVGVVIAELIMIIRVWALWRRSRTVGAILIVAFVTSIIIAAVIFSRFIDRRIFVQLNSIAPNLHGCFTIRQTPVYYQGYLLLMAYETLIAGLMLAKGAFYLRHGSSSYITGFYKDGVVYYAALLTISAMNVGILLSGNPGLADIFIVPQRALHSMLSARILLNLRKDYTRRQHYSTASSLRLETLVFDDHDQPCPIISTQQHNTQLVTWFGEERND
ncbi:DUF6533 domain-containing protein [Pleurotus pulmonarius]